jgi:hypothetical protein
MKIVLCATALLATLVTGPSATAHENHRIEPCEYEDGSSQRVCVWDARHMGNGEGSSYIIWHGGTDNQRVVRITHRRAHHLMTK